MIVLKTVLLADQTVGETYENVDVGDVAHIILHDENGMIITKTGIVEEILVECDTCP